MITRSRAARRQRPVPYRLMPVVEQLQRSAQIIVESVNSDTDKAMLWEAWFTVQNEHLKTLDSLTR